MTGSWLDLLLLVAGVAFAVSGFRQGAVVGLLSFAGFIGGGVAGVLVAPTLVGWVTDDDQLVPLLGIVLVFGFATLGQVLLSMFAAAIRRRVTWAPAELLDSVLGAAVATVGFLMVAWLVGTAVAHSPLRGLAQQVRHSAVLTAVDSAMPPAAESWFASFQRMFNQTGVPQVFGGLGREQIRDVQAPDPAVLESVAGRVARTATVQVRGVAEACGRSVQGSGFPYAPERVLTNAHVVAGVDDPVVVLPDGERFPAVVVVFDPTRDVAVLHVPDLPLDPLPFGDAVDSDAQGLVAGYPGGGALTLSPARVRDRLDIRGPDIYHERQSLREIYSLRTQVDPGNSGGPFLSADGEVLGLVFAESLEDENTGYAVTADELAGQADAGRSATEPVDTRGCAVS